MDALTGKLEFKPEPLHWAQNGPIRCLIRRRGDVSMRIIAIWLVFGLLFTSAGGAEPESGTVCVASRAADPFRGQVIPSTGEVSSGGLQVKVDKRPAVPWPQRQSLKIEGLDLRERHLLAVLDARGKAVESLWFRFTSYSSIHLCMSYDGYQGIGLVEDGKHCPWCRCKYAD